MLNVEEAVNLTTSILHQHTGTITRMNNIVRFTFRDVTNDKQVDVREEVTRALVLAQDTLLETEEEFTQALEAEKHHKGVSSLHNKLNSYMFGLKQTRGHLEKSLTDLDTFLSHNLEEYPKEKIISLLKDLTEQLKRSHKQ